MRTIVVDPATRIEINAVLERTIRIQVVRIVQRQPPADVVARASPRLDPLEDTAGGKLAQGKVELTIRGDRSGAEVNGVRKNPPYIHIVH